MKAPHPFPCCTRPLPGHAPQPPEGIPLRASFFTIAALLPIPSILALYGMDGLILPAIILGGHACLAFAAAAIGGIFLGLAAREREEPRKGLLALALLGNVFCVAAAFVLMFRLHEPPERPDRLAPSILRAVDLR